MGHTIPPFTWQFQKEKGYFSKFRRALLLAEDKGIFDVLWNKAEFHITPAEKTSHPLPVATILMMMNLEQQKTIQLLEQRSKSQGERIEQLEKEIKSSKVQITFLRHELAMVEENIETRLQEFRREMLAIKYPEYEFAS